MKDNTYKIEFASDLLRAALIAARFDGESTDKFIHTYKALAHKELIEMGYSKVSDDVYRNFIDIQLYLEVKLGAFLYLSIGRKTTDFRKNEDTYEIIADIHHINSMAKISIASSIANISSILANN